MRTIRTAVVVAVITALMTGGCTSSEVTQPTTTTTTSSTTGDQVETTISSASDSTSSSIPSTQPPVEAEGQGWRLVVFRPGAGTATGPDLLLCYEVTGSTREATVALDVALMSDDSVVAVDQVDINVGRGSAVADLSGAASGEYDVVVGLILNGVAIEEIEASVGPISLQTDAPVGDC